MYVVSVNCKEALHAAVTVGQEDLVHHSEAENMMWCVSDQTVIRNNIQCLHYKLFVGRIIVHMYSTMVTFKKKLFLYISQQLYNCLTN